MVFGTDSNIARAKELLTQGDAASLRYACLELRFALERIAYQKLQLRLSDITVEEIAAWQPKRVMDRLMELVDPALNQDSMLSVALEGRDGQPVEVFQPVGTNKGVNPKDLGKHWQKLGSNLHVSMPKRKGEHPKEPDPVALRMFIQEVIGYVENITSTGFDSHFSVKVTFTCGACKQTVVRNSQVLKDGEIVQCQNSACDASYRVLKQGDQFIFETHTLDIPCINCKGTMHIAANKLLKLDYWERTTVLCECGTRHVVVWRLYHALHDDVVREEAQSAAE
jgi:hypothetical protein